jgi:hypothetical protein
MGGLTRLILYMYVLLVACPIRYWAVEPHVDPTWRFALNYAAAHGLTTGVDTVFTTGPLAYLMFPEDTGNNLVRGLVFQAGLWLVLAVIFADLFFRGRFPVRNLVLFSFCFGLSAPIFWFNGFGVENLVLAGALLLMVLFRFRGSLVRYVGALALIGTLPLFKLTACMMGFAALAGFLIERAISLGRKALPLALLTAVLPVATGLGLCLWAIGSVSSVLSYLRGSLEVTGGYSSAMSLSGGALELASAFELVCLFAAILCVQSRRNLDAGRFYALFLAVPMFVAFKNGFVRQDMHILIFFCFMELAFSLVLLTVQVDKESAWRITPLVIISVLVWQNQVLSSSPRDIALTVGGVSSARALAGALRLDRLRQTLRSTLAAFPEPERLEPEILAVIGNSPVASLSPTFTNVAAAGLPISLYPVVQRYSAYTPYLDSLNAAWVRDKGTRFLVFDGSTIDERDAWAETPAMWLEIYRWYDTRLQGSRNLLFERRAAPRFARLEPISRLRVSFPVELRPPASHDGVFWTMKCGYSALGRVEKLLFRIPPIFVTIVERGGNNRRVRIIPELLVSPVAGNYWPGDPAQFAALLEHDSAPVFSVDKIVFGSEGMSAYSAGCDVEFLRLVR